MYTGGSLILLSIIIIIYMGNEEIKIKQPTSYMEYNSRILKIEDFPKVINEARNEYKISVLEDKINKWEDIEIPLNLERKYIDNLLEIKDFDTAKRILERMKISYTGGEMENLLESYEYRLQLIEKMEKLFKSESIKLKQELNQHNITTISIIAGIVVIFGVANQTLISKNFNEGLITFITIISAVCVLMFGAFLCNSFFCKKK